MDSLNTNSERARVVTLIRNCCLTTSRTTAALAMARTTIAALGNVYSHRCENIVITQTDRHPVGPRTRLLERNNRAETLRSSAPRASIKKRPSKAKNSAFRSRTILMGSGTLQGYAISSQKDPTKPSPRTNGQQPSLGPAVYNNSKWKSEFETQDTCDPK